MNLTIDRRAALQKNAGSKAHEFEVVAFMVNNHVDIPLTMLPKLVIYSTESERERMRERNRERTRSTIRP